jgi:hypothetical protein
VTTTLATLATHFRMTSARTRIYGEPEQGGLGWPASPPETTQGRCPCGADLGDGRHLIHDADNTLQERRLT